MWRRQQYLPGLIAVVATFAGGCIPSADKIKTEYGRSRGAHASSVNGTSVLAEMVAAHDVDVRRHRKLSPRIGNLDTIVWVPDSWDPPSPEVIDWFEDWLQSGYGRTLIYVGRDFDAQIGYWQHLSKGATGEQHARAVRKLGHAIADLDQVRAAKDPSAQCDWFGYERLPDASSRNLAGPWSHNIQSTKASVQATTILVPPAQNSNGFDVEELLTVDGRPFAFLLTRPEWDTNQFLVISNGSFLLNLPLVNHENRRLANHVVELCAYDYEIAFLESGAGQIEISDRDGPDHHNTWGWIAEPPLRYIVPHFLFWGVLFCFVYFPIFGRPKRVPAQDTSGFRRHVVAMGRLLERAGQGNRATRKIQQYQHMAKADGVEADKARE